MLKPKYALLSHRFMARYLKGLKAGSLKIDTAKVKQG
jgi:hypothetical protein